MLLVKQEQLEASGLVSDLKLQMEMQKERVKETAKQWASIQMIKQVIRNKLERHKNRTPAPFGDSRSIFPPADWRKLQDDLFF